MIYDFCETVYRFNLPKNSDSLKKEKTELFNNTDENFGYFLHGFYETV